MTPTFAPHGIAFPCASWPQDAQFFFANRRFRRPNRIDLTGFRPAMGVFHMNRPDLRFLTAPATAAPARLPYTDRRKNCGHVSHHHQPAITAGGRLRADRRGTSVDHAARHQGNGDGRGKQPRRRTRWCRGHRSEPGARRLSELHPQPCPGRRSRRSCAGTGRVGMSPHLGSHS